MNKLLLMNILRIFFMGVLTLASPANAEVYLAKQIFKADGWPGAPSGSLHQIDEESFITVARIGGEFGIHRIDMETSARELLMELDLPEGWPDAELRSPKFVTGDSLTLVDVLGDLYSTDGTIKGTRFIQGFGNSSVGGSASFSVSNIYSFQFIKGSFYLKLGTGGFPYSEELLVSDGLLQGTIKVVEGFDDVGEVFSTNDGRTYFFGRAAGEKKTGIWAYDRATNKVSLAGSYSDVRLPTDQAKSVRTKKGVFFCSEGRLMRFANNATLSQIGSNCEWEKFSNAKPVSDGDFIYFGDETRIWRSEGLSDDQVEVADATSLGGRDISNICFSSNKIFFTVRSNREFTSRLYKVDAGGKSVLVDIREKIYIDRCLSQSVIVSLGTQPYISAGIFNSATETLSRIRGLASSLALSVISEDFVSPFSPTRIPMYLDSMFFVAWARDPTKVDIVKTTPQTMQFIPSILDILL